MSGQRPERLKSALLDRDAEVWAAAQRAADSAPELRPGDAVFEDLRPLLAGELAKPAREERGAA
jgi:hypothetical protein